MVWDKWGVRKEEYDRIKKYKRTKESEGLFNRTPSKDTLFKANTDSQSWDGFSFVLGGNKLSARDIKAQLRQEQTGIGSCLSNKECPTGYACIDGQCVKIYTRDSTTWGTCGEQRINFPCKSRGPKTKNECSSSRPGPGDCLDSGCGSGPKCCRQNANGDIDCYCGDCESNESGICSIYCDTTYKLFGTVWSGCGKPGGVGLCDGNICDECSECEYPFGGGNPKCEKYEDGDPISPCWCSGCNEPCERCNTDPDSSQFGDCYVDGNNCYSCCSVTNPECTCGPLTELGGSITACSPYYGEACAEKLQKKINALCEKKCATEPDPCAPTGSTKYCVQGSAPIDPSTNPEGPAGYTCPEGKRCKYTGYLEGNGKTCYLFSTWVIDEIPEDCEKCDCNCNDDCPDCKLCGADGECYDDPDCNVNVDIYLDYEFTRDQFGQCFSTFVCFKNQIVTGSSLLRANVSIEDARKWSIVLQPQGSVNTQVKLCTGTCVDIGGQFACQGGTANCTTPDQFAYIYDQDGNYVASYTVTRCWQIGFCNLRKWQETFDRFGTGSLRFEIIP
jgi:hypothetical protein